jgi:hypothetical protein
MNRLITDAELLEICSSTLEAYSDLFRGKTIDAEFYPYIGLTHVIRRRQSGWIVRISDFCRHAPVEVVRAIAVLLAAKIARKKPPGHALRAYESFRHDPEVIAATQARRRQLGRKRILRAEGEHHSLAEIYRELNERYFGNRVEIGRLGWGARRSWRRLGHYDPVHHTITISPVLDSARVPRTVLAFLLYHEMLHTLFSESRARRRQRHHTREFSSAERAFPHYAGARRFLDEFCRTRGRSG